MRNDMCWWWAVTVKGLMQQKFVGFVEVCG